MYLLVYLDALILTGNNDTILTKQEFSIKDLRDLSYFLGLEASYIDDGFLLSHIKLDKDVLTRVDLIDCKPIPTLLAHYESLTLDGPLFSDPNLYQSLIGDLQYLTITRSNLSYVIN